jgi:hypothetical protein
MIIFFEYGRIGNQLFQYQGLKNYFPKHKLFFFGCASLQNTFNIIDATFINLKINSLLHKVLKKIFFFFIKLRILGEIKETTVNDNTKLYVRRSLLWNVYIAHNIYFQHASFINKITNPPSIKKKYLILGKNWLIKKEVFKKKSNLVFVHIRRGDYLSWPDVNFPAALDLRWYKKNMLNIKNRVKKPIFVIMGDDTLYLRSVFKESKNLIISNNLPEIDLSIMSLCSCGILSASSFAWWGAFYAKIHNKKGNYFVAPKYWIGHRSKKWLPKNFFSKWITYVNY